MQLSKSKKSYWTAPTFFFKSRFICVINYLAEKKYFSKLYINPDLKRNETEVRINGLLILRLLDPYPKKC